MRGDTSLSLMAREILAYLTAQPDAQDTLDGIARWWSAQSTVRYDRAAIEKALAELVGGRVVMEVVAQGSPSIYRLARRKKGN